MLEPRSINLLKNHFARITLLLKLFNSTIRIKIGSSAIETVVSSLDDPLGSEVFSDFSEDRLLLAFKRRDLEPLISFLHQMVLSESGDSLINDRFSLVEEHVLQECYERFLEQL